MGLIDTPKVFLQIWGIWPLETIDNELKKKMYMVYRVLFIGWYTLFNISQTIQCIRLIVFQEPFDRISRSISVVITLVLWLWKGMIYLRNNIPQMCVRVRQCEDALMKLEDKEIRVTYNRVVKSNHYMNIMIITASVLVLFSFIGVSFIDVIIMGDDFWESDNVTFMHELYLPFEKRRIKYLIIIANIFIACESVVLNAAIQITFFGLTTYATLRFKVIQIGLKKLSPDLGHIEGNLKGFLKEHQDSIRFVEDLNNSTKTVLFMGFLLNSIKVASVLLQIITVKDLAVLAFPFFYFLMQLLEVYLLGWMCNEVKEQSLAIADAAYSILWYNENKNVKVMLQIMIMRAQKPLTMTIGPFGPMTTDTIVTTLKAAYSYATLMMGH